MVQYAAGKFTFAITMACEDPRASPCTLAFVTGFGAARYPFSLFMSETWLRSRDRVVPYLFHFFFHLCQMHNYLVITELILISLLIYIKYICELLLLALVDVAVFMSVLPSLK